MAVHVDGGAMYTLRWGGTVLPLDVTTLQHIRVRRQGQRQLGILHAASHLTHSSTWNYVFRGITVCISSMQIGWPCD